LESGVQVLSPLVWREALDGVPEHDAGCHGTVPVEETLQGLLVALADFSEHPAGGFVNQVFLIAQEHLGDLQRVANLALPDEPPG
jgi:hypothetical protein